MDNSKVEEGTPVSPEMKATIEAVGKLSMNKGDLLLIKSDDVSQEELNALRDHLKIRLGFWPAVLAVGTDNDVSVATLDPSVVAPLEERIVKLQGRVEELETQLSHLTEMHDALVANVATIAQAVVSSADTQAE